MTTTAKNNFDQVMAQQEVRFIPSGVDRSEFDSVAAGQRLAAGPIFLKRGPFRRAKVPPGTVVIITQDFKHVDTLREGGIFTLSLPTLYRLEQYVVDVRPRILKLESWDDFRITYRGPGRTEKLVTVSVEIHIEYRVVNPELIIFAGSRQPMGRLYAHALDATRNVVEGMDYDIFLRKGPTAPLIRDHLQALRLEDHLGIEVVNVSVLKIGDNDVIRGISKRELVTRADIEHAKDEAEAKREQDRLSAEAKREQDRLEAEARRDREWRDATNRTNIAELTGQDARLLVFGDNPEIVREILAGDRKLLEEQARIVVEMLRAGTLASLGLSPQEAAALLSQAMSVHPSYGRGHGSPANPSSGKPAEILPPIAPSASATIALGYSPRLMGELNELNQLWQATGLPVDANGWSAVQVNANTRSGRSVTVYLQCPPGFPDDAPTLNVLADRRSVAQTVPTLASWTPDDSLFQLVREAIAVAENLTTTPLNNVVHFDRPTGTMQH